MQIKALDQWLRDVPLQGERGDMFDVNGKIIASCDTTYTLYARPNDMAEKEEAARLISSYLGLEEEFVRKKINTKASEVTIKKGVTKDELEKLVSKGIKGLYFSQNISRRYVYGDFLSQVIGFTNIDSVGQTGLESKLNDYLSGNDGYILTEADLVGRKLPDGKTFYVSGEKGADVYLTIDYSLQKIVQNAVEAAFIDQKSKAASCIVMNVKSGAIAAIAQSPSFDLNNIPRDDVATLMALSKNTIISNVYEPGSTFKILTASIGLENKVVSTKSNVYCPGYRMVDGNRIKCWKTIGHGSQTFQKGVQNSCNCLFMDVALSLGKDRMYEGLEKFGINVKTGVDLPGEASGLSIKKENVKNVDLARIGFGQAIAVTAIELITACSAVINDGYLLQPFIVDKIVDQNGKVLVQGQKEIKNKVIGNDTSKIMRETLETVVTEGGGKNAAVKGYRIGGKTGTAQKYDSSGRIAQGKYVATFIGFTPADDPEYILLFIVDEPSAGAYYGSVVAAPYAARIFSEMFNYLGYKSDVVTESEFVIMPDLIGLSMEEADKIMRENNLTYECIGEGKRATYQLPAAGANVSIDTVSYISFE